MCPGEDKSMLSITSSDKDIEQQFRELTLTKLEDERKKRVLGRYFQHLRPTPDVENNHLRRAESLPGSLGAEHIKDPILPNSRSVSPQVSYDEDLDPLSRSHSVHSESQRSSSTPETTYLPEEPAVQSRRKEDLYQQTLKQKKEQDLKNYDKATKKDASEKDKEDYLNPAEWLGLGIEITKVGNGEAYKITKVVDGGAGYMFGFKEGDQLELHSPTNIFDITKDLRQGNFEKVKSLKDKDNNIKIEFNENIANKLQAQFKYGAARTYHYGLAIHPLDDDLKIDSKIKSIEVNYKWGNLFNNTSEEGVVSRVEEGSLAAEIGLHANCKIMSNTGSDEATARGGGKNLEKGYIDACKFEGKNGDDITEEVKKSFHKKGLDYLILTNVTGEEGLGIKEKDEIEIYKEELVEFLKGSEEDRGLFIINDTGGELEVQDNKIIYKEGGQELELNIEAISALVDFKIKCGSLSLFNRIGGYYKDRLRDSSFDSLEKKLQSPSATMSPDRSAIKLQRMLDPSRSQA